MKGQFAFLCRKSEREEVTFKECLKRKIEKDKHSQQAVHLIARTITEKVLLKSWSEKK